MWVRNKEGEEVRRMTEEKTVSLAPLNLLLFVAADERFTSGELSSRIKTLNALLEDLGKSMSEEMKRKWRDEAFEVSSDCEENRYGFAVEMQKLCVATLRTLQARFYEVVEEDYLGAAGRYEEAADIIEQGQPAEIAKVIVKSLPEETESLLESRNLPELEEASRSIDVMLSFVMRFPAVDLWDAAGDAYCRAGETEEKARDARRSYEHALQILKLNKEPGTVDEEWETRLCHVSLSLANLLLARFDEWGEAEALYREAADAIFFNRSEKDNKQYHDICWIIADEDFLGVATSVDRSVCAPHVYPPVTAKHEESLTKLKAELGQKALDELKEEFDRSEEGFPVPETYYLVAVLGELYMRLGQHEKCANVFEESTSFSESFFEWTYDQLCEAHDWAFPFVVHTHNESFARGLLQRPDYKEFVHQMEKVEESHQRQEWRLIRQEKMLRGIGNRASLEEIQNRLVQENPWLDGVANLGSVVNADAIYQQLKKQNWGEVVMGYCNAVEEELKPLYKEYLTFRAGFDKDYVEESERQKKQWSVLYFIASMTKKDIKYQLWKQFVIARVPEHSEFILNQLPGLLAELVELRNPSAHGKMQERERAKRARQIVLGKADTPGLLKRLNSVCPKKKDT